VIGPTGIGKSWLGCILLEDLARRYGPSIAVRSTLPRRYRGLKAAVIGSLGGKALTQAAAARCFAINRDFRGVYDFTLRVSFAQRMAEWLASISDLGLIMCHPEAPEASESQKARVAEHEFLASFESSDMRERMYVALKPFTHSHFAVADKSSGAPQR
jgi:hypothetical protein